MNKFYNQINEALISYEEYKPHHIKDIDWICNRIDWCWKWKKISHDQMEELTDRICKVMENIK